MADKLLLPSDVTNHLQQIKICIMSILEAQWKTIEEIQDRNGNGKKYLYLINSGIIYYCLEKDGNHIISTTGPKGTSVEETDMKSRVSVNKNMQLVIENIQLLDEKIFICRVEDQNGAVKESKVHLKVYKAPDEPEITMEENGIQISDEAIQIGTCESNNGFPTPNITWYKNNTPLKNGKDGVVVTSQVIVKSNGLITVRSILSSPVEKSDVFSWFYCDVSYHLPKGSHMLESERRNITVDYPNTKVNLLVKSKSEMIKEGDIVELICKGDGNPQPQISLHRSAGSGKGLDMWFEGEISVKDYPEAASLWDRGEWAAIYCNG
ncbi:unnamed protein product [Ranitomeya imitator]|uniref:Ig-like domain-containing protein n=1 Tax=Ranitomeya imitator TaxID=111125 RepID=A0ABN9LHY4_9NEOB|nr:unnamed protein product [Ranitomeya imitator]